jgi:hypothetical protein
LFKSPVPPWAELITALFSFAGFGGKSRGGEGTDSIEKRKYRFLGWRDGGSECLSLKVLGQLQQPTIIHVK